VARTYQILVRMLGDASHARGEIDGFATNLDKRGKKMQVVGAKLTKKVTLPILAIGAATVAAANTMDKGLATIRVGTGATGTALDGLNATFVKVARTSPSSIDDVATAVADLNTRMGLTGKPLEQMTRKMTDLSRITGTDVRTNVQNISRLFGDWSVKTGNQSNTMDRLFRVSQSTGIGIDQLSEYMVQFGSPLRQLGFGFDQSAAMFAKFEKEGVNIQTLMPGLKMSLKNLSKPSGDLTATLQKLGVAGKDPQVALRAVMKEIKNAPSTMKANQLAFQVFGTRAGPDMAAAIREGRFELGDLMNVMENGSDTIGKAAADSMTFSDRMKVLKNRATVAAAPFGRLLIPMLDKLVTKFEKAATAIENMTPRQRKLTIAIAAVPAAVAAAAGPVIWIVGTMLRTIAGIAKTAAVMASASVRIVAILRNWAQLFMFVGKAAVKAVARVIAATARMVASAVASTARIVAQLALQAARWAWLGVQATLHAVKVAAAWLIAMGPVGWVIAAIGGVVAAALWLYKNWDDAGPRLKAAWTRIVGAVKSGATSALNFVKRWGPTVIAALAGPFGLAVLAIVKNWTAIRNAVNTAMTSVRTAITTKFNEIVTWIAGVPERMANRLTSMGTRLASKGREAVASLRTILGDRIGALVDWFGGVPARIAAKLGTLGTQLAAKGAAAGTAFATAIKNAINSVLDRVRNFTLPSISVAGKTLPGTGTKPFSGIPRLATGGITDGPMLALIGDNPSGREAVVPLGGSLVESRNRQRVLGDAGLLGGSGGGVSVGKVEVHISGPVDPFRTAREIRRELRRSIGSLAVGVGA
jgi:TP901 family phage tail tape measure protein